MLGKAIVRSMSILLREQKDAYRKRIRNVIQELDEQNIENQSRFIHEKVWNMPEYQCANSISVFLSMPGKEVSTRELVSRAFKDGKLVFVPYIYPESPGSKSKVMDMLQLRNEDDFKSLKSDNWGIPSLSQATVSQRLNAFGGAGLFASLPSSAISPCLDLIFVPAVAFDIQNHRLGHGRGFYDRYLAQYQDLLSSNRNGVQMPKLVGLALKEQMLDPREEIPTNSEDWRVDIVVSAD